MPEKVTMHRKIAGCLLCRPVVYLMCMWTLCLDTPPTPTPHRRLHVALSFFWPQNGWLPAFLLKTEGVHASEGSVILGLHFVVKAVKY